MQAAKRRIKPAKPPIFSYFSFTRIFRPYFMLYFYSRFVKSLPESRIAKLRSNKDDRTLLRGRKHFVSEILLTCNLATKTYYRNRAHTTAENGRWKSKTAKWRLKTRKCENKRARKHRKRNKMHKTWWEQKHRGAHSAEKSITGG